MLKLYVLFALSLSLTETYDPNNIDYCNMKCKRSNDEPSGCNCTKKNGREDMIQDFNEFRQIVVNLHNKLRNKVARGDQPNFPSAMNMHALSYDMELEYLARCFLLSRFGDGTNPCITTPNCLNSQVGRNIIGSADPSNSLKMIKKHIQYWYNTFRYIPPDKKTVLEHFKLDPKYGVFTQLIWATIVRVGCAWVRIPDHPKKNLQHVFACLYSTNEYPCSGNIYNWPTYMAGEKCNECGDSKCNKEFGGKYDALCGDVVKLSLNRTEVEAGVMPGHEKSRSTTVTTNYIICLFTAIFNLFR